MSIYNHDISIYTYKLYKLLKKSMEYYFCLDLLYLFLHYIHMSITFPKKLFISLHFAKKTHENRSGEIRITVCQMQ